MDDVEKVKLKIDIVDLIGEYIPLKKSGRNFKAVCPFHGEKSASFTVSPERQIWHCFGCSLGGDAFTFLEEYDKIDFSEALKYLADKAGVKLTASAFKTEREKRKDLIYTLNALAAQFYHYLLTDHSAGKIALDYLLNTRKIPEGLIKKFSLGYAPSRGTVLSSFLTRKKGYKKEDLIEAGLASIHNGRLVDFFRHRIMFPIYDTRGNIIAFSGRALEKEQMPKYVNTRETLVYKKGDTLFGLYQAKEDIKKEGKALVVEGEFDVISAFHEGIKNIVAVKGTALTESQVKVLKRFTPKVSFCFDTDPAGTAAQRRSIQLIEKEGVLASVVVLPRAKDPDELLHEDPIAFKKAVKEDVSIYDYILDTSLAGTDPTTASGKTTVLEKALPYFVLIENEVVKEHYLKKLAGALDTSYDSIVKQTEKLVSPTPAVATVLLSQKPKNREEMLEEYLLALLLQSKNPSQYCSIIDGLIGPASFSILAYNRLFRYLKDFCQEQKEFILNDFVKMLPPELLEVFDRCYLAPLTDFKGEKEYDEEIVKIGHEVKMLAIKNKLKGLTTQIRQAEGKTSEEELDKLRVEFQELAQLLK